MEFLLYGARLLHYTATMVIFGGSLFRQIAGARAVDRALRPVVIVASTLSFVSALGWLLFEAGSMAGDWSDSVDPTTIGTVLRQTQFGQLWTARLILGLGLVAASMKGWWTPIAILAGLSLASLAGEGHSAWNGGGIAALHSANQAVHLLAAGAWFGGLPVLALLLQDPSVTMEQARLGLARFSSLGYIVVSLVLITGAINTALLAGNSSAQYLTSAWTATLAVKLTLVALMLGLAIVNRVRLVPPLAAGDPEARNRLYKSVLAEIIVGILVLAAVSVLGTLAPPSS